MAYKGPCDLAPASLSSLSPGLHPCLMPSMSTIFSLLLEHSHHLSHLHLPTCSSFAEPQSPPPLGDGAASSLRPLTIVCNFRLFHVIITPTKLCEGRSCSICPTYRSKAQHSASYILGTYSISMGSLLFTKTYIQCPPAANRLPLFYIFYLNPNTWPTTRGTLFQSEIWYGARKWKTDSSGSILIPAGVLFLGGGGDITGL